MNIQTDNDFQKQRDEKTTAQYQIHVIVVEEMTKTNPFVQCVQHLKGLHRPTVTLLIMTNKYRTLKGFVVKRMGQC